MPRISIQKLQLQNAKFHFTILRFILGNIDRYVVAGK